MKPPSITWNRPIPPVISTVRVEFVERYDIVHVWSRGKKAGELVVDKGDWRELVTRLGFDPDDRTLDVKVEDGER